jgi:hypothetical protein
MLMIGMLVFGAANTLVMKYMDNTVVGNGQLFNHPYFQGIIMFTGELMCLFVYFIKVKCCTKPEPERADGEEAEALLNAEN